MGEMASLLILLFLSFFSCAGPVQKHRFVHPPGLLHQGGEEKGQMVIVATGHFKHYEKHPEGLPILSAYLKRLSKVYGGRMVLVNMGPLFEDQKKALELLKAYDHLAYDGMGLYPEEGLNSSTRGERRTAINSNIIDMKTGAPLRGPGIVPYKILERGGIKIGLISVFSPEALSRGLASNRPELYIQDPVASVVKFKNILREKEKVQAVVLLAHLGTDRKALEHLVGRMPPDSVQLILSHGEVANADTVGGVPTLPVAKGDPFLSVARLSFDGKARFLGGVLIPDKAMEKILRGK